MNTKEKYTKKELETIEGFFTDSEWLAIEEALEDYKHYGDNAAELASQIGDKIFNNHNFNSILTTRTI